MLRLTRLSDYGILLMSRMAMAAELRHTAGDLAAATRVPSPTVSKVLQMLLQAGLLDSTRGAHGGYRLARAPELISVREVIQALEGAIALTECNLDDVNCEQSGVCATSRNWKRINDAVCDALDAITLADMTRDDFMPVFRLQRAMPVQEMRR